MQIRRSIFWFITIVAVLIALVLWLGKRKSAETQLAVSPATNVMSAAASALSVSVRTNARPASSNPSNVTNRGKSTVLRHKVALLKEILQANDADIVFYGRLEDQFSNAVSGAVINFSIQYENASSSGIHRGQVVSDANGFFTITGYRGEDLGIMPKKTGYALASTGTSFRYSQLQPGYFVPDANNPVIVKMWKLQGAEHLASFNIDAHLPVDGTPVRFDLQTGQQTQSGGDLIVRLQSSAEPNVRVEYDWQASFQMVDGGMIRDSSGAGLQEMFQAPDSGYEPQFDLSFQKGTQRWTSRFIGGFYFTSHGGEVYGKMAIEILSDVAKNGTVPLIINGCLNPAGSRNLENNPAVVTGANP